MTNRIRWFAVAMIVCFCALLFQLDNIQGIKASQYQKAARNPDTIEAELAEPRGDILSADGDVLAQSVAAPASDLYKYSREYPTGSLFASVVGFSSFIYGTYTGVEGQYNPYLTYKTQTPRTLGQLLTTQAGTDTVVLTLFEKLQQAARTALAGKDGAVVAIDPSDGNILAMYSNPTYNPNLLASQSSTEEAKGWADYIAHVPGLQQVGTPIAYDDTFAPGSTFKVITSAAAYDHKPSLANVSLPYAAGYEPPGTDLSIHNDIPGACGGTLEQMLPPSCDTGYAHLGVELGAPTLTSEGASFGFFATPPIDLPTSSGAKSEMCSGGANESACTLALQQDQPFLAYSAIGQGNVAATPLEMALVAAGIADDGVIMTPHVMSRIIQNPDDTVIDTYKPKKWLTATSASTAAAVSSLMQLVVTQPNGTAHGLFPSTWDVAAKTGTAQAQNNTTTDWMIAFAPASAPKIAIAVVVPNQGPSATGASVSGPIMKQVLAAVLGAG